ncbi:MAG: hypothetical protein AAF899_12125 [Pseudomonadota bacterium]
MTERRKRDTDVGKAAAAPQSDTVVTLPGTGADRVARPARVRRRHRGALYSFLACMVLPAVLTTGYLYLWAADQYASVVAFSVRTGETPLPQGMLGGLLPRTSSAGTDAEIVYEVVRSQPMVEAVAASMPLETMYNRPEYDVVFRLGEDRPIEDIVEHWNWMTNVYFDGVTGMVRFEARAFRAEDAQRIASFVLDESNRIINSLNERSQEDALRVARNSVEEAEDELRAARAELRSFRNQAQEVNPSENASAAMGLVAALEEQLATQLIDIDSQRKLLGADSPRIRIMEQRAESVRNRIAEERQRLGVGETGLAPGDRAAMAGVVSEFEELAVDVEIAQAVYTSALSALESAKVDARRQSRFLVPHIVPTRSVEPQYPQRAMISLAVAVILLALWSVGLLIAYNIRDRR